MPVKLLVLPEAIEDIQAAAGYYNRKQSGLGRKFEKEVKQALSRIKAAPLAASFAYDTVRYKVTGKFPFIILYEEQGNLIFVLRVFNTYQEVHSALPPE